jgi:hypothetical protein
MSREPSRSCCVARLRGGAAVDDEGLYTLNPGSSVGMTGADSGVICIGDGMLSVGG